MRAEPSHKSELVNQVLFGEIFKVLDYNEKTHWAKIELLHDDYQGWIDALQIKPINEEAYLMLKALPPQYSLDMVDLVMKVADSEMVTCLMGSMIRGINPEGLFTYGDTQYNFSGPLSSPDYFKRYRIIEAALTYLNAPYLWGGRTHFGVDCSGLVQMAYRQAGILLPRDAYQQAKLGQPLSFIEESLPGDLAFFDNEEGRITHVGILLENNKILHASSQVKIDLLDQTGIFSKELNRHTHRLRLITNVFDADAPWR
jgi:hypothetical protein